MCYVQNFVALEQHALVQMRQRMSMVRRGSSTTLLRVPSHAGLRATLLGLLAPYILFKNLIVASLAAITWWLVGYGVAFGTDNGNDFTGNDFIGTDNYAFDRKSTVSAEK